MRKLMGSACSSSSTNAAVPATGPTPSAPPKPRTGTLHFGGAAEAASSSPSNSPDLPKRNSVSPAARSGSGLEDHPPSVASTHVYHMSTSMMTFSDTGGGGGAARMSTTMTGLEGEYVTSINFPAFPAPAPAPAAAPVK